MAYLCSNLLVWFMAAICVSNQSSAIDYMYQQISCAYCPCLNNGQCLNMPTGAFCNCVYPYTGRFCEFNLVNVRDVTPIPNWCLHTSSQVAQQSIQSAYGVANACLYLPGICQNEGTCLPSGFGTVRCVCQIPFTGEYCEKLAYVPCPTASQLCSVAHGNCSTGNNCICQDGYRGPRCDLEDVCNPYYCLNNGTCTKTDVKPFRKCTNCSIGYEGDRCEKKIDEANTTCAYTLSLINSAGFLARFSLIIYTNGYRLEAFESDSAFGINSRVSIKVSDLEKKDGLEVVLEAYTGSYWDVIAIDKNLGFTTECTKCYKVWGKASNN